MPRNFELQLPRNASSPGFHVSRADVEARRFMEGVLRRVEEWGQYKAKELNVLVVCGSDSYSAHSCMLVAFSEVFERLCEDSQEKTLTGQTILDLSDLDQTTVGAMLNFIYTSDYLIDLETPSTISPNPDVLYFHAKMYHAAWKYDIDTLKDCAIERFSNIFSVLCFHNKLGSIGFMDIVRFVYTLTPDRDRPLRDVITRVTRREIKETDKLDAELVEALQQVPGFGSDIAIMLATDFQYRTQRDARVRAGEPSERQESPGMRSVSQRGESPDKGCASEMSPPSSITMIFCCENCVENRGRERHLQSEEVEREGVPVCMKCNMRMTQAY